MLYYEQLYIIFISVQEVFQVKCAPPAGLKYEMNVFVFCRTEIGKYLGKIFQLFAVFCFETLRRVDDKNVCRLCKLHEIN